MLIQVSKLYAMLSTGNKVFSAQIISSGPITMTNVTSNTIAVIEVPIFMIDPICLLYVHIIAKWPILVNHYFWAGILGFCVCRGK